MIINEDIKRNAMLEQQFGYAYDKGDAKGYERGIEQGSIKKQNEIVINMYKKGISLDIISEWTNLSINEVNNIIKNTK